MSHKNGKSLTPKEYEELRLLCSETLSTRRKGGTSQETKDKISKIHKGKTISKEHKLANSSAVRNYLLNTPEGRSQAQRGGKTTGKLPWWNKDGITRRSYESPGEGRVRGRGKGISPAMAEAGSKNKGKVYWSRVNSSGEIERRRSFSPPSEEWTRGYNPG